MREIKFRAWDEENNKFYFFNVEDIIFKYGIHPFCPEWDNVNRERFSSLEQYTGLKDKNGKEDYVGNIWGVWFDGEYHKFERTLELESDGYIYGWKCLTGDVSCVHAQVWESGEIIGNIHES